MTFERFKEILAYFPKKYSTHITITAEGEPFLNKDIFKMIEYAKKERNLFVNSSTNGVLLTDDQIGKIVRSGI